MGHREGWIAHLWSRGGDPEALVAWLRDHGGGERMSFLDPSGADVVRMEDPPEPLRRVLERTKVGLLIHDPSEPAGVHLRGTREAIRRVLEEFEETDRVESVVGGDQEMERSDPLTEAEREALLDAYEAGYFEVPRRIKLSELADKLDRSSSALSTLLRRAQGRLIAAYVEDEIDDALLGSMIPPDEETRTEEAPRDD